MVKTYKDYLSQVQEKFPFLTLTQISTILRHGLYKYSNATKYHVDVDFYANECNGVAQIRALTGNMSRDPLIVYKIWHTKWRMKERWLAKETKFKWDGYYYFGVSDEVHKKLLHHGKLPKGTYLTKLRKELYHFHWVKHIWRIPYPTDVGWRFWTNKINYDLIEYVGKNHYEKYHKYFRWGAGNRSSSDDDKRENSDGRTERNDNNG